MKPLRLEPLLKILSDMPQPKGMDLSNIALTHFECLCGKLIPLPECRIIQTGVRTTHPVVDGTCPECAKQARGMAQVVCLRCHRVVALLKPRRDPDGFRIDGGRYYHIEQCPKCVSGTQVSHLVERMVFDFNRGKGDRGNRVS